MKSQVPSAGSRPGARGLGIAASCLLLAVAAHAAPPVRPPVQTPKARPGRRRPHRQAHWEIRLMRGNPGGFIQVRENAVRGTPLPLGSGLGLSPLLRLRLGWRDPVGPDQWLVIRLDLSRFSGQTQFPRTIYFNGVGLAPGRPVYSDTPVVEDWQLTAFDRIGLGSWFHRRLRAAVEAGFTYVGLTFKLNGSLVNQPNQMSGPHTMEDFITQELPVPQIGLRLVGVLSRHWSLVASILGGHLPNLYSLRNEGGKVYVTQTDREADLGVVYRLGRFGRIGFGWYDRYYMQHEVSQQDGNYIRMTENGLYLGFSSQF